MIMAVLLHADKPFAIGSTKLRRPRLNSHMRVRKAAVDETGATSQRGAVESEVFAGGGLGESAGPRMVRPGGPYGSPLLCGPRFYVAVPSEAFALALLPWNWAGMVRATVAWDLGGLTYLLFAFRLIFTCGPRIKLRAARRDDSRLVILTIILLGIAASFAAIAGLIGEAKLPTTEPSEKLLLGGLAVLTIMISWIVTQVAFALHYAHDYYRPGRRQRRGRRPDFPGMRPTRLLGLPLFLDIDRRDVANLGRVDQVARFAAACHFARHRVFLLQHRGSRAHREHRGKPGWINGRCTFTMQRRSRRRRQRASACAYLTPPSFALVVLSYFFLDRQFAAALRPYTHDVRLFRLAHLSREPVCAACVDCRRFRCARALARGSLTPTKSAILRLCCAVLIAGVLKEELKSFSDGPGRKLGSTTTPPISAIQDLRIFPVSRRPGYASFPSGHTTAIAAVAGSLWCSGPRLRWLGVALVIAVAVGSARRRLPLAERHPGRGYAWRHDRHRRGADWAASNHGSAEHHSGTKK